MKVFVSSTYLDLKDYRVKAKKAIEESENEFVGMEVFQSHTHEPSEFCAENVEECDAFILIVAYRYGSIPAGENNSITQSEYELALRKKIPVRIYLMDDNHPWPSSYEFRDKNPESINGFRNLLKKHTCSFFTTPDNLYDKLKLDIQKFPIPPSYHPPYSIHKNFTGRNKEREVLTEWLRKDSRPMLSIIAIGGMGKTALTWYWLTEDIKGSDEQPRKIFWWSFYDREAGFDRFLRKAIEYFTEDKVEWNLLLSTRDKMDFLFRILSQNRYLIVLDGVERVLRAYFNLGSPYQGDEIKTDRSGDYRSCIELNCSMFLQWIASNDFRTKTLLTSRLFPRELEDLEGCIKKELTQLDKDDAVEFFEKQGVNGTRAEFEDVCNTYGSHPLSLRLLTGMIVHDLKSNRDIKAWTKYNPLPKLIQKEHHILELAYNSLDKKQQEFISKLSAFRNLMDYDAVSIFNNFGGEEKFNEILNELVERGMLFRDDKSNKFDMHPILRKYCYDRLGGREGVHSKLKDYFSEIPAPEKIESVYDLAPIIELYHHTVRAGRYDEAMELYMYRLLHQLYYRFGAYQTEIELLSAIFPDGENKPPRLIDEHVRELTLNELANSYALSGQPKKAVPLFEMALENAEKRGSKKNVVILLGNLANSAQIIIGELNAAESNLRRSIEISLESKYEFEEAVGHQSFGRLFAYRGKFDLSENELKKSSKYNRKAKDKQGSCLDEAYSSFSALVMSSTNEALRHARKARELANSQKYERDIIVAEYLLGAAYFMNRNLPEAEKHLNEALIRDRKINLIELEPDILLELAKLKFRQSHKPDALKLAEEALHIIDRCEYRLKQADIHNFLAEFYLDAGDLAKARHHGESAKERAGCGYVPAMEKAKKLLKDIDLKGISAYS